MKKKFILLSGMLCICLVIFGLVVSGTWDRLFSGSNPGGLPIETRAVWLNDYAFNSPETRSKTVDKIERAHLNTVFLIAPPIEGSRGWSDASDFQAMLDLLLSKGLSAHVWVCNLYRKLDQKADFLLVEEQTAQKEWALSLMGTYPALSGVHFDYIRYENLETVNKTKMDGILATLLATKTAIKLRFPGKHLTAATWSLSGEIREPMDELPDWYSEWYKDATHDDINRWRADGYAGDGYPSCFGVQQDPVRWINKGAVDYSISMEYDQSVSWWKGEVDIWNSFLGKNTSRVFMGLGWYKGVWDFDDTGTNLVTPITVAAGIVDKIEYGRTHRIKGFSLFEFGEPGNDDEVIIKALASNPGTPFYNTAQSGIA